MTESSPARRGRALFLAGWWVLLVLTALFTLNHLVAAVVVAGSDDERRLFLTFAALQILAIVLLLIPYRRGELWAWWAMWIPILAMVAAVVGGMDTVGIIYTAAAVVMALAQLATLSWIRRAEGA